MKKPWLWPGRAECPIGLWGNWSVPAVLSICFSYQQFIRWLLFVMSKESFIVKKPGSPVNLSSAFSDSQITVLLLVHPHCYHQHHFQMYSTSAGPVNRSSYRLHKKICQHFMEFHTSLSLSLSSLFLQGLNYLNVSVTKTSLPSFNVWDKRSRSVPAPQTSSCCVLDHSLFGLQLTII